MKKTALFSLLIILYAGLYWGCEKKGDPPTLPPPGSMTIDFGEFIDAKKSAFIPELVNGVNAVENTNWIAAATVAGTWNLILAANIAVPVASFAKAVNNTPVYLDNKTWEWNYSVNAIGAVFNARLTGEIRSTDIKWEMHVSREGVGAFAEFLWFEGSSQLDGKKGQWILNHSQQYQEPMLRIDWEDVGSNIGKIKYTYIRELKDNRTAEPFKDSYIEYGLTTNTLNAYYTVSLNLTGITNDFETVYIEWSTTGHNGRIKSEYYFQDTIWHCWNILGANETCPVY